ncbi:MAG: YicC/YloC family endoribonuclease [Pseudomonadota bacterium]
MSIHSMTAFARETDEGDAVSLAVEIRSVNHRYLDTIFKLPEGLRSLEASLRDALQRQLSRGKVEVQFRWQDIQSGDQPLVIDRARLAQLRDALDTIAEAAPTSTPPSALEVLAWPGVIDAAKEDADTIKARALSLFERALASLLETRAREGEKLQGFIEERLTGIENVVRDSRARMPELLNQQQERLRTRLAEFAADVDEARLEQEMVMLAQKADVEEELDRLAAHVEEVTRVLHKGGPCGRRLDFLMQELNREANTLSSKSFATSTTRNAVELKVLIEQMREQIQNLE